MLAPGLFVWSQFVTVPRMRPRSRSSASNGSGASACPGKDGKLGTSDTALRHRRQSARAESRRSRTARTMSSSKAADLHLPIGKPVKVLLRSIDVLHDFYVPEFRAKMDMIPGSVTYFWFTPTRTGTFEVLCAELCGAGPSPACAARSWSTTQEDYRPGSASSRHSRNCRRPSRRARRTRSSETTAPGVEDCTARLEAIGLAEKSRR